MKVVILAGGLGTRLQSVVKELPKPMAPIADTPFLDILMQKLLQYGADEFILCVSYKREKIQEYFGDYFYGMPVRYSVEEEPLGTGGAIKQAFEQFDLPSALVLNGDTYVQLDYRAFWQQMQAQKIGLVLKQVPDASRYGLVQTQNGRAVKFCEKSDTVQAGLINAGIYYLTKEIFSRELPRKFSFEKELLEPQVSSLKPLFFKAEDYFIDIGIPSSYAQACRELKDVVGAHKNKALFLDRDGVINVDTHYVHEIDKCQFVGGIFDLCRAAKAKGYKIIVVTNQAGIAKGKYTEEDYFKFRDFVHARFAAENCPIDAEYYCPFHEEGIVEKYRKASWDRKPNPGMILRAVKEMDIDVKKSILIGDKQSDIDAGKRAGVGKTVYLTAAHNPHPSDVYEQIKDSL